MAWRMKATGSGGNPLILTFWGKSREEAKKFFASKMWEGRTPGPISEIPDAPDRGIHGPRQHGLGIANGGK
jgi:hypothetical protein